MVSGPDLIADSVRDWLEQSGCGKIFITAGTPWENPDIESFIGKLRNECLNCEILAKPDEARLVIETWRGECSTEQPHSPLGYLTPAQYAPEQA